LGVVLVEAINYIMVRFNLESGSFANPEIDFQVAVSAIIVLAVAGTLAGLIPGTKAAKVDPVIALRDEQ
jgi:putative ABC transport system permease protein